MNASARTLKCRPCLKSLSPEEVLARASWSPQDKPTSYGIVTVNGKLKVQSGRAAIGELPFAGRHCLGAADRASGGVGGRSASEAFYETEERTLQEAL